MIGRKIGSYEIVAKLGEGGMGEVYRARDTRLNRDVALKVLPSLVADDPDRLARFRREAQVLASLNHPNIAHLYGFEDIGDTHALVMELVDGSTLADRIAQGPIPLADALPIARQIADAFEAAHEQGIVHRDLKPANVKVRPDGTVKVLDFGLAKALSTGSDDSASSAMNSPTLTARATQLGMVLGTAAYMAPEQARGRAVDRRADIWAFGVVVYEMLTGRRAFEGDDISITLANVLKEDVRWDALPPDLPTPLRRLLRRCLEKDPKRRLSAIGDARIELEEAAAPTPADAAGPSAGPLAPRRDRLAWIAAAVLGMGFLAAAAIAVIHLRETPAPVDLIQFNVPSPENSLFYGGTPQFAISPDGKQLVFVASQQTTQVLWVRPLGALVAHALGGTDGAYYPFWSHDSRSIAFFSNGKLKKVQAGGGPPFVVCDAPAGRGGTWNQDNVIVFSPSASSPLQRVPSAGGTATPVTTMENGVTSHRWPSFLPDGNHFLYLSGSVASTASIQLGSLDGQAPVTVMASDSAAHYAAGHVLFIRSSTLMAQSFDASARALRGDPFPVAEQAGTDAAAYGAFSPSATGLLAYAHGGARPISRLTWFDRAGKPQGTAGDPAEYFNVALSPDERRVAVSLQAGTPANRDLWFIDLARAGTPSRFTFDPASDGNPVWSPDGTQVAFTSNRTGIYSLYQKAAGGSGQDELLLKSDATTFVGDWSSDTRFVSYSRLDSTAGMDLWVLPMDGDRKPSLFLQTPFNEDDPVFSPNVKWIAYDSNESGTTEVYVRPFPAAAGQFQISRGGGVEPMWRADGKELFFLTLDGAMMSASIDTTKTFEAGVPQALFPAGVAFTGNRRQYAVSKDGKRFLVNFPERRTSPNPITVVVNWLASVQK